MTDLARMLWLVVAVTGCVTASLDNDAELARTAAARVRPSPRGYGAMVWNGATREYVLLGGVLDAAPTASDEVWAADASGRNWRLAGKLEPAVTVVTAAYHEDAQTIVVWFPTRQRLDGGGDLEPFLHADAISETWLYDVATNTWTFIATADGPPKGLLGTRMSYDAESKKMILFGGIDFPTFTLHDDTWAFDLESRTWTNMQPATHPTGRNFHGQVYHRAADRVLVIAGLDISFEPTNHVWAYDYNHNTWTQLASPDAPKRDYVAVSYVDEPHRVVLHGGMLYGPNFEELPQSDTWEFDLAHDRWSLVDDGVPAPGPRVHHAIASQRGTDKVLVFGGGNGIDALTDDVWRYSAGDRAWREVR